MLCGVNFTIAHVLLESYAFHFLFLQWELLTLDGLKDESFNV